MLEAGKKLLADTYPERLQGIARERYDQLPESGTVADLIKFMEENISLHDNGALRSAKLGDYALVGFKTTLTYPTGQESREVIITGFTYQYHPDGVVWVTTDDDIFSTDSKFSAPYNLEDNGTYREIKWGLESLTPFGE